MQTSSGFPSPVRSANVGDSLSVGLNTSCRRQCVPATFGFSYHDVNVPGNPTTRMSFQLSLLKSWVHTRKLSEYLFSCPSAPSKPGTVTVVIGPSFNWNVAEAG